MMSEITKWLYKKVSKYSDSTNKELLDLLFYHLNEFIINNDLIMNIEQSDLLLNFYIFNHNKYLKNTNNEYFDMKYHEDIVNLFIVFKEITESYGSDLYSNGETADILLNFINQYVVCDSQLDDINDIDEELILDDEY